MDGRASVYLTDDKQELAKLRKSFEIVEERLQNDEPVYGVNTGVGESCRENVPPELTDELPENLVRFHGCGTGEPFSRDVSRGILAIRLITLSKGASGVRVSLLRQLCDFYNRDVIPVIPEEGSVGASGDLTPLSYLAATVMGERSVWGDGEPSAAADILAEKDLEPMDLRPKESLALMNGTSAMTALTAKCFRRATYLLKLTATMTGMLTIALEGNRCHFNDKIYALKDHPGQRRVARAVRRSLGMSDDFNGTASRGEFVQDRYSLRCVPQILGVLADSITLMKDHLETEINGVDDNPLVDVESEEVLHGGNFYGGHVAFVADNLKNTVANIADLMDRQLAQLVDPKMNQGLPPNLIGVTGERQAVNHGFKA
ncbi:MAG: histidine ammonia-lyase, partial [bacterium]